MILVRETVADWPHTLPRLKMLLAALYKAGWFDSAELPEQVPVDCEDAVKP